MFNFSGNGSGRNSGGDGQRCSYCDRQGHTSRNCPLWDSDRSIRRAYMRWRQRVAATSAVPSDQPPHPPPPPPTRAPAPETTDFAVGVIMPQGTPWSRPPPAPEPQTGRPASPLGWSVRWCPIWARWYYRHFLDDTASWEVPRDPFAK